VANIQRVHAEDSGDFRVALLQHELRQRSDTKFFRRHFERADGEIVEFCCADFFGPAAVKLCRDPRRFRRESIRCSETFVQDGDKRAGIDQQMRRLAPNEHATVSAPFSSRRIGTRVNLSEAATEPRLIRRA